MTEQNAEPAGKTGGGGRFVVRLIAMWILLPLFFLATGGTFRWWQAWAWCALLLVPMSVFGLWMAWKDPEFLARRFQMREKERAQRRILAWGWPLFIALALLPGLDRRFGWSDVPLPATVAALALSLAGYCTILRVFIANRWAARTIETFGGQQVISTGPYAVVRHPMYAGTLVTWLATPIALGSWWALLPALAIIPVFVFRIRNEEAVLVRELQGYEEYRGKVRYRLVPLLW